MKYASTDLYLVVLEVHSTVEMLVAGSRDRWLQVRRVALLIRSFAPPPVLETAHTPFRLFLWLFRPSVLLFLGSSDLQYCRSGVPPFSRPCVLLFAGSRILRDVESPERRYFGTQILRNSDLPELRVTRTQILRNSDTSDHHLSTVTAIRWIVGSLIRVTTSPLRFTDLRVAQAMFSKIP